MANHQTLMSAARGSATGEMLRRQWLPFLPAIELDDNQVQPVRLLGEGLVCYRDNSGTIGLIGEFCGHQLVELKWGYPDDHGLRCSVHDWCYDETGQCTDIPFERNVRIENERIIAYAVREFDGLLFAYLGEVPHPNLLGFRNIISDVIFSEISYSVFSEHWLRVLARQAARADDLGERLRTVKPNVLVIGEGGPGTRIVVEVPMDAVMNTLEIICRVGRIPPGDRQPPGRTKISFTNGLADNPSYREAVRLAGVMARTSGTDLPECGCSGDAWAENFHVSLLDEVKARSS